MSKHEKEWRVPLLRQTRVSDDIRERLKANGAKLDDAALKELRELLRLDDKSSADHLNSTKRRTR